MKEYFRHIRKFWNVVLGDHNEFSLESRIFHTISAVALITLLIQGTLYLYNALYPMGIITLFILVLQSGLYYLSRFKNKLTLAISISAIEINITTAIGYFFNSGITGGSLLLFSVSLFLVILVVPKKQWLLWFLVNFGTVCTIVACEYLQPQIIQNHHTSRQALFLDMMLCYCVVVSLLYVCTIQIRKSFYKQKLIIDDKALRLQLLNDEKDKLFSIISHDLTSPLAAVKQYLNLLGQVSLDPDERSMIEQDLIKSVDNAQDLLSNLLQWAKSQMQNANLSITDLNLKEQLISTVEMFRQIALNKAIELDVSIDNNIIVTADKNMLQLVIRNLLNNAIKFTHKNGRIELRAILKNKECIISIKDNGIGIPLERQSKIFSLNVESTYGTINEKGTGLGLNMSKEYTQLQGGNIWFTSQNKKGSTFYLSLPAK
ncbi:sensor histidine kinase [Pedobacter metabolipauper]|uniref:histidine kinase n=1 Tax=Pedobacter metabolipauper TaxID=425513 RepID=A0A4R6SX58_9SPHI|nr:HAMP domain-containing sensor histidine kinase [Pedobacter metabolipauper]TDQ10041.1 histidine kinase/DNA gyrase B/HSP90-like ATPase [Pedobacter metabolipauper]